MGIHKQWYVLQTKSKKELVVSGLLSHAGYEIFIPRIRGFGSRLQPLFPRYCFLNADLEQSKVHHLVRFTRGVSKILGDQSGPVPLEEGIVETIRATTAGGSIIEQELLYRPHDKVIVKAGVLSDLVGIVEKNLPELGRVRILFKWLSRKITADVDYRYLERVA